MFRRWSCLAGLVVLLLASPCRSDMVFATYLTVPGGSNADSQTNPVGITVIHWPPGVPCQVRFGVEAAVGLPPPLQGPQITNIMLMNVSTASAPVHKGDFLTQSHYSGTIEFLLATPFNGKSNLLTMTFSEAQLQGVVGGTTLDLTAAQSIGPVPTLAYSSDFINFNHTTSQSFDFTFNSASPLSMASDLQNFQSTSSTGTFSSNPLPQVIPEPPAWMMAAGGLLFLLGIAWKTRAVAW